MHNSQPSLADAISAIKREIKKATDSRDPTYPEFILGEVTIDLEVTLSCTVEGGTSVNLWVLDNTLTGSRNTSSTHKVSVKLTPSKELTLGSHTRPNSI